MPHAGPGRVLRATTGYRGALATEDGVPLFNFGFGPDSGPALNGTRYFLAAAQLVNYLAPAGYVSSPGDSVTPNSRSMQPSPAWGARGTLIRTPRTAVVVIPFLTTGGFDPSPGAEQFERDFADAMETSGLSSFGVQVCLVKPAFDHPAWAFPLLAPCHITNAVTDSVTIANIIGGAIDVPTLNVTADGAAAIGGDAYWAFVGSAYQGSFGNYTVVASFGTANDNPDPVPDLSGGPGFVSMGSASVVEDAGPDFYAKSAVNIYVNARLLGEHSAHLAAVAGRCRSFRFAVVNTDEEFPCGPTTVHADTGKIVSNLPIDANPVIFTAGTGSLAAAAVIADMRRFFGL